MFIETFKDEGDREAGVEQMLHKVSSSVNTLLGQFLQQFHTHAFTYTKETLVDLVPLLSSEDNYYNLGAVLHYLQRRCKHSEFRNILIENEIGSRMASYIVAIYIKFNALKIPCPLDVPWRTLGEAVRIINAINYQEIIELCRVSSADEVRAYIKEM